MGYFKDEKELEQVVGGFLRKFPGIDPLIRVLGKDYPMTLKLELEAPKLDAAIDLTKTPLEIQMPSDSFGTVGMVGPADNFHELLLGNLPLAIAVNSKQLVVRGSLGKLMKAVSLFYVAPAIYPPYLESIGREDLISINEDRPKLHGDVPVEGTMSKIISAIAYIAGYAIGFIKRHISPDLDVIAALESMGKGLQKATGNKPAGK